jgi:hypothetical protein
MLHIIITKEFTQLLQSDIDIWLTLLNRGEIETVGQLYGVVTGAFHDRSFFNLFQIYNPLYN